jgi:two-component system heavy metal sensor histidine kinase CusS
MFWKNDKSLVIKLMVLYALSTIGILASIGLFLYPTFVNIMLHVDHDISSYLMTVCYERISAALLFGSLVAVLLGYYIAKKSLNRINEFARKMESITADSLHERIDSNEWPSELNVLGEKFNHMLDRLEKSFTQLSQFSSDIAHELRNPIHHLMGITELALTKDKSVDEYKKLLETAQDEYQHLSRLIENLLFLARADHGQMVLQKEKLCVRDEMTNLCEFYQAMADEKNIAIHCEGDAALMADKTLFKRVLNNLLANALQYTPQEGWVRLFVSTLDSGHVQLVVSDSGVGIGEEHVGKVFDRFYRVDSSRASESGGMGLGLAMVKSIVELHEGEVWVESFVGRGTEVGVLLP